MSSRVSLDRIGLTLFVLLTVGPVALSLLYAALYAFGLAGLLSGGFTLVHVRRVLESGEIWSSAGLSVYVAATVVVSTATVALPLALLLRRRLETGPLRAVVSLPLAIPGTVAAVLVLHLLSGAGLLSRVAYVLGLSAGIDRFPPLVHDAACFGVILAHVGLAVPFFVLLFAELYRSERVDALQELAATLGAGRRQRLARVALPVLMRRAVPSLALLFVVVLGSFEVPLLLGRQSPQMLSILTYRKYGLFDIAQKPEAYLLALGYTLLVVSFLAVAFRGRTLGHEN